MPWTRRAGDGDDAVLALHTDAFSDTRLWNARLCMEFAPGSDTAVWLKDDARIAGLLEADGWVRSPNGQEDGSTLYERATVQLELAFLARADDEAAAWAFDNNTAEPAALETLERLCSR
jgi:hypothetical protein